MLSSPYPVESQESPPKESEPNPCVDHECAEIRLVFYKLMEQRNLAEAEIKLRAFNRSHKGREFKDVRDELNKTLNDAKIERNMST